MKSSGIRFSALLFLVYSVIVAPLGAFAKSETSIPSKGLSKNDEVAHVLSRLTFGARPGDVERVSKMGVEAFIAEQLAPDNIDDSAVQKRLEKLPTLNLSTPIIAEQYYPRPAPTPTPAAVVAGVKPAVEATVVEAKPTPTPAAKPTPTPKNPQMVVTELQRSKLLRAVYSERQLNEVMVDFWMNHFSIYAQKDANRWLLTSFDRDSVRPFAMGRFRDLLGATARSPAMLYYLDNWQSSLLRTYPATKDKPERTSGGINENYARELMELHTLGVDGGYTQKDVQEVARCFTGWSIRKPNEEGTFYYNPAMHDNGEKTVLGVRIPAGGGIADGERVLDILAKHPSTARYVATKLARRYLGDTPPDAVIKRAAKEFVATDGSITETLRSIITAPEFLSAQSFRSKVKSPFEFVVSALRVTAAETDGDRPLLDWVARMGQPVYGRITPDGYPDMSTEWLSNNDLISRVNFASALAFNTIRGTRTTWQKVITGLRDRKDSARQIEKKLLFDNVSESTRKELDKIAAEAPVSSQATIANTSLNSPKISDDPARSFAGKLIALAIGSPEFQRK